jgi:uncharacterized membrane protein
MVAHQAAFFPVLGASSPLVWLQYPLIPWVGVIAAGYAFGAVYELDRERRIKVLLHTSMLLIAAFIAIRTIDNYGDPSRWSAQPTAVFTFLSFINTTKYPPSLLYLLMTLGPALLALAWFEASPPGAWRRSWPSMSGSAKNSPGCSPPIRTGCWTGTTTGR